VYSAYDDPSEVVLAHDAGADDHVSKNADFSVLEAKIRRALERHREFRRSSSPPPPPCESDVRALLRGPSDEAPPVIPGKLTQLEERLFRRLVGARGAVVPVEFLLREAWHAVKFGRAYCTSRFRISVQSSNQPAGYPQRARPGVSPGAVRAGA